MISKEEYLHWRTDGANEHGHDQRDRASDRDRDRDCDRDRDDNNHHHDSAINEKCLLLNVHCHFSLDINECSSNEGRGPCEHICINTLAGYICQCNRGFSLNTDKRTCKGENE